MDFERYLNRRVKIVFSDFTKEGKELRFTGEGVVVETNSETLTLRTDENKFRTFTIADIKRVDEI